MQIIHNILNFAGLILSGLYRIKTSTLNGLIKAINNFSNPEFYMGEFSSSTGSSVFMSVRNKNINYCNHPGDIL